MDLIQKATISLLNGNGAFYASLLMQMIRVEGKDALPEGALMGVNVVNGRIYLYTNCELYGKMTMDQVAKGLEHEALHLILEHGSRAPGGEWSTLWNVGTDLAINSIIPEMDIGLIPGNKPFEKLPKNKTAEFYYGLLRDKEQDGGLTISSDGKSVTVKDGKGNSVTIKIPKHKENKGSSADGEKIAREVVKQAVQEAKEYSDRTGGGPPGHLTSIIEKFLEKSVVSWKQLLRQYVGNAVKCGHYRTWKRPSRRFGEDQKGKTPERILEVAVAIDTSGSVTDADLKEFMTEIQGIRSSYKSKIHVVECGTQVDRTYDLTTFSQINSEFFGRGGGDFRPVFEYYEHKRKRRPDVLVYMTDCYEAFPNVPPKFPTIWVRPSQVDGSEVTVPFGRVIQVPRKKDRDYDNW